MIVPAPLVEGGKPPQHREVRTVTVLPATKTWGPLKSSLFPGSVPAGTNVLWIAQVVPPGGILQ